MTQHAASVGVSDQHRNWHLVTFLIRQPLWLLGWAAAAAGLRLPGVGTPRRAALRRPVPPRHRAGLRACSCAGSGSASTSPRWRGLPHCSRVRLWRCFSTAAEPHGGQLQPEAADWISRTRRLRRGRRRAGCAWHAGDPRASGRALRHRGLDHVGPDGGASSRRPRTAGDVGPRRACWRTGRSTRCLLRRSSAPCSNRPRCRSGR